MRLKRRGNICINCWETNDLSQFYYIEDQSMGGWLSTSIPVAMKRVQLSVYSRSKMETASVGSPRVSGNLQKNLIMMMMMIHLCSTFLRRDSFKIQKKVDKYGAKGN